MKKFILPIIALALLIGSFSNAQTPHFYYYKGEKQYLNIDKSRVFVSVADTTQLNLAPDIKKSEFKKDIPVDRQVKKDYTKRYWQELTLQDNLSANQYQNKVAQIKQNNSNAVVSPYFTTSFGDTIGLSNFLYVQLHTLSDTTILKQQASNYNATVVCQDKFMPLWFVVSVSPTSNYNAMELANIFHESGLFQSTESDFIFNNLTACVNDTYFSDQWGLNNTGQYGGTSGIDIKACDAWNMSTGSDIVVAVLDHGIELNHPDLVANIYPQSYDTYTATSPSVIRGSHGTACAGIIGAVRNNNAGITGVAPNCKLMSISSSLSFDSYTVTLLKQQLADGINWARLHGADVISNSWGHNDLQGSYITNAINNAVTQGRGGKGCVVVFAAGNNNASSVLYPANLSNVIAVGAVSPCGQRKSPSSCDGETNWGSNYGADLDVVAPGVLIPTTDRQEDAGYNPNVAIHTSNGGNKVTSDYTNMDYTVWFNGTSAACPHVAGVAALILSYCPGLKQEQVRHAIESSCTKINPSTYTYINSSLSPNGTWNNQVGHGLVNAYAALNAIMKPPKISYINTIANDGESVSLQAYPFYQPSGGEGCPIWNCIWKKSGLNGNFTYILTDDNFLTTSTRLNIGYSNISISCASYNPDMDLSDESFEFCTPIYIGNTNYQVAPLPNNQVTVTPKNDDGNATAILPASAGTTATATFQSAAPAFASSQPATINYSLVNQITGATAATGQMPSAGATLNFASVPAGIYVLTLETAGTPESHKVVLQ